MKRLIILSGLMLACTGLMFGQKTTSKTTKAKDAKTASVAKTAKSTKEKTATVAKTEATKTKTATTNAVSTKATTHLKKDGTADMRYKENKQPKGPTKKDGTLDMRYKVNKDKAKTKDKTKQ